MFSQDPVDGSWDIDIYVQALGSCVVTISGRSGEEIRLDRVRIEPDVFLDLIVNVESTGTRPIVELRELFLTNLPGGVSTISGDLILGTISIDKTAAGTLGSLGKSGGLFDTERISVIDIEGDILSSLNSNGTQLVNNISCGGSLRGDILIGGNCNGILVGWQQGGGTSNIGASGVGNDVSIDVAGNLVSLTGDNIYADIDVGGNLQFFQVEGSWDAFGGTGTPDGDGEFIGSLVCDTMSGGSAEVLFRIYGDLSADVTVEDELASGRRMGIGGDLVSTGSITFTQSDGLKGDITIGWLPSTSGQWLGDITVGSTDLLPKGAYTQTGLGGGFVAEAPYGLHKQSSTPAYTGSAWPTVDVSNPSGDPITIDLVHYGDIEHSIVSPSKPFEVTWAAGDHCDGPCIHGTNYDDTSNWSLDGTSPFPDIRTMRLNGTIVPGRHYHIYVDETLRCLDTYGSTVVPNLPYVYVIYGY